MSGHTQPATGPGPSMRGRVCLLALAAALEAVAFAPPARADGDPGSDVLVYQPLFLAADAGVPVPEQVRLGGLLRAAARSGFPVRVAIIAAPSDLGAVTGLWLKPRAYARFLGLELSLAYTGRLLVVMPNGLGFNWPGHSPSAAYRTLTHITLGRGGGGLAAGAEAAVRALVGADGIKLGGATARSGQATPAGQPAVPGTGRAAPGASVDALVAIVAVALAAAVGLAVLARRRLGRSPPVRLRLRPRVRGARPAVLVGSGVMLLAGAAIAALIAIGTPTTAHSDELASNPSLDPGTPLTRPAPGFTLTDQFGRRVSLEDVLSYSQLHGMLSAWHFLTGSLPELQRVWKAYGVQAAVQAGEIAHTPALFVIDPHGRERRLYITQQSYAAVGQLGQLLAQEASNLLPEHPPVNSNLSYAWVGGITPATPATLPRAGGGSIHLAPGRPRAYAFFATWDRQITGLAAGLEELGRYSRLVPRLGLPALEAVDEASVEPAGALSRFLATLPHPLPYPVAIDRDGRVADGYEVEGLPWLMVVTASGRIAYYYSVAALGWPSTSTLIARVKQALARAAAPPTSPRSTQAQLAESPPALAALHRQASQLLDSEPQLAARIRALRGYPIVINAWASWCAPCRSEFGLFGSASARYGHQVAFLGVDTDDSSGDARSFLTQHPVSYPSYQTTTAKVSQIVPQGIQGLPTTIFINRAGKLAYVHTGQYDSQGTLDADIKTYALEG